MNPSSQVSSLAAPFADQEQAGRVYRALEAKLRAIHFDAHVSRLQLQTGGDVCQLSP